MLVAAFVVSIVSLTFAGAGLLISWRSARASERSAKASERSADAAETSATDARRSADAAESTDRRERQPNLAVHLVSPAHHPVDAVIYRLRNDGPQDLDEVTVFRPRPSDGIVYPIAVTGGGDWAEDEIRLGTLRLAQEVSFTLCCGAALVLPEFRVRVECRAGPDVWKTYLRLPAPRIVELAEEERSARRSVLTAALLEIEHNLATLNGPDWNVVGLEDDQLRRAELLLRQNASQWIGPIRDAVGGIRSFRAWIGRCDGTIRGDELHTYKDQMVGLLIGAVPELESMSAALDAPQASGRRWSS